MTLFKKNGSDENITKKIIYIKRNIIKMSEHDYFAILILVQMKKIFCQNKKKKLQRDGRREANTKNI